MPTSTTSTYAYVTMATNDDDAKGAVVLGKSLRNNDVSADVDLVVMATPHVSFHASAELQSVFDHVVAVDVYDSSNPAHGAVVKRPELGKPLTKVNCWGLTQYQKCVFMDPGTMVLQNIDDLFNRDELSAVADAGWPDLFNTGVFVFKPANQTLEGIIKLANDEGSYDGGDQGLLNSYFSGWGREDIKKHLSFLYNLQATSSYTYSPAFARFGKETKVIHFVGGNKPWTSFGAPQGSYSEYMSMWKGLYEKKSIQSKSSSTVHQKTVSGHYSGQPEDYQNSCKSFDEIQQKISEKIGAYY